MSDKNKYQLAIEGDQDQLVLTKVCPFCKDEVKATPRAVINDTSWSDYNHIRTNRMTLEFEAVHQCR